MSGALLAWRYWLRISLERKRYAADRDEHAQRQAATNKEFRRWSEKLEARPKDADMATWLDYDRTILLGETLEHFRLPPSQVKAHAFLEEPGVAVKRARAGDSPWRYAVYRLQVFLLDGDGVRQVKANLSFTTGTLTIRERTSYRYDTMVSVCISQEAQRLTFELKLIAGDPIKVQVRNPDPGKTQPDQDARPAGHPPEAAEADENTAPDAPSMAALLHMLEGIAGGGRNWFQEHGCGHGDYAAIESVIPPARSWPPR